MKKLSLLILICISVISLSAQDTSADCMGKSLKLNIKKGTLNKKKPTMSPEEVKEAFPCFTGETEENSTFNCGGGIFYLNHDFYFYTHRDYLEVRTDFKGKISKDLLGKSPQEIKDELGEPDKIPQYKGKYQSSSEVALVYLYKTRYGALEITFDKNSQTCKSLGIHYQNIDEIVICW